MYYHDKNDREESGPVQVGQKTVPKKLFQRLSLVAEISGVIVTIIGIILLLNDPASRPRGYVAIVGVFITCVGIVIRCWLSKQQQAEKEADSVRIAELEDRLFGAEEVLNDPMHKMAIDEFASRYHDEHQDDDR